MFVPGLEGRGPVFRGDARAAGDDYHACFLRDNGLFEADFGSSFRGHVSPLVKLN